MSDALPLKVRKAIKIARSLGYDCEDISPREFYDYMTGKTVSGDRITLEEVLRSEFLMVHEIVEISELKKKGITIDNTTVVNRHSKTIYEAHLTAMEYEIKHAFNKGDLAYVKLRLIHVREWLDDENLPKELIQKLKSIIEKLSENR
ncbi:MAG: hypothetical protein FGF48_09275 [Candidatus Brockarchaeota archaeon]|nr:hypothetical protein [Candidatus Brockarchaeota archaeon]